MIQLPWFDSDQLKIFNRYCFCAIVLYLPLVTVTYGSAVNMDLYYKVYILHVRVGMSCMYVCSSENKLSRA